MKTLKVFAVLSLILVFPAYKANSQSFKGTQQFFHEFTQDQVPCLTETVSGVFTELQIFSNNTYHATVRQGIAKGSVSGEDYTVDYEYNQLIIWRENGGTNRFTFPIVLKHDGKLVAVIHYSYYLLFNGNGVKVLDGGVTKVECR
jgi:hypothetical protein